MSNRASEDILAELHSLTAKTLIERLQCGDASPAEISNAIRFLKDNGIEAAASENEKLRGIVDALPDFEDRDSLSESVN